MTYLILRERDPGVWVEMEHIAISANHELRGRDSSELVTRAFMGSSGNAGGRFAVVAEPEWRVTTAKKQAPLVEAEARA